MAARPGIDAGDASVGEGPSAGEGALDLVDGGALPLRGVVRCGRDVLGRLDHDLSVLLEEVGRLPGEDADGLSEELEGASAHLLLPSGRHLREAAGDEPLDLRRKYWLKHTTRQVAARVTKIDSLLDINTQQRHAGDAVGLNGIARVTLNVAQPLAADSYDHIRATGAFILIDEVSHQTVAAGMIRLA